SRVSSGTSTSTATATWTGWTTASLTAASASIEQLKRRSVRSLPPCKGLTGRADFARSARRKAYDQAVKLSFCIVDGTATTSDNDFIAKTGTLTFAPGETTKTITIEVKGDSKKETDETFYLDLFDNSGNALFTKSRGIGMILNDD